MGFWGIPVDVVAVPTNPIDSDVSTVDTIQKMRWLARKSSSNPKVVQAVEECITRLHSGYSRRDLVRSIYWWIRTHVTFCEDEEILAQVLGYQDVNRELLVSPPVLLSMPRPMGDCDDFSTLCAAMLGCVSVPVKFIVIACDKEDHNRFSHVYCAAYLEDEQQWIPFDASHGKQLGWEYQGEVYRRVEWLV